MKNFFILVLSTASLFGCGSQSGSDDNVNVSSEACLPELIDYYNFMMKRSQTSVKLLFAENDRNVTKAHSDILGSADQFTEASLSPLKNFPKMADSATLKDAVKDLDDLIETIGGTSCKMTEVGTGSEAVLDKQYVEIKKTMIIESAKGIDMRNDLEIRRVLVELEQFNTEYELAKKESEKIDNQIKKIQYLNEKATPIFKSLVYNLPN